MIFGMELLVDFVSDFLGKCLLAIKEMAIFRVEVDVGGDEGYHEQ